MKGSIRVSAKTLDDAITEALVQLGVTSDKLEYEVIEKGSAGFLGIGMKQAVIEAWPKAEKEPEPETKDIVEDIVREEKEPIKLMKDTVNKEKVQTKKEKKNKKEKPVKEYAGKQETKEAGAVKETQELAKVEEQTIRYVEKFVHDTLSAMNMKVEIKSSIDEDGALCVEMIG